MPSQVSLRASPVLSNSGVQKAALSKNSADENAMNAAARTVGSLLSSVIKPHSTVSINFNGSCGRTDNLNHTSKGSKPLVRSNGTTPSYPINRNRELDGHAMNTTESSKDVSSQTPVHAACNSLNPCKTEGKPSNEQSSLTQESNKGRLMCPDLADTFTGMLIKKRIKSLANKQTGLESRIMSLQRQVRFRQLHAVHSHVSRQAHLEDSMDVESLNTEDESTSSLTSSDYSMEIPPIEYPKKIMPLPIQVDGASDDAFLPCQQEVGKVEDELGLEEGSGELRVRTGDSFSSLESFASGVSSEAEESCVLALTGQVSSLQALLDDELTDSSDDEEDQSADIHYRFGLHARLAPLPVDWAVQAG